MNLRNLKRLAIGVGLNGAVEPGRDGDLRIGGLGSEIVAGITQALADRVHTDEGTGIQVVLACNVTSTLRVHLRPLGVGITGEQLGGVELVLRVAVAGRIACGKGHGGGATKAGIGGARVGKALHVVCSAVIHSAVVVQSDILHSGIVHRNIVHGSIVGRSCIHRAIVSIIAHIHTSSRSIVVRKSRDSLGQKIRLGDNEHNGEGCKDHKGDS